MYWIGLKVQQYETWPNFGWVLPTHQSKLYNYSYSHWGVWRPGSHKEPNNIFPPEHCAVANRSEAYDGAFGWADMQCNIAVPYICECPCELPSLHAIVWLDLSTPMYARESVPVMILACITRGWLSHREPLLLYSARLDIH